MFLFRHEGIFILLCQEPDLKELAMKFLPTAASEQTDFGYRTACAGAGHLRVLFFVVGAIDPSNIGLFSGVA